MAQECREQAILHINAGHLHFATFFLLLPEMNTLNLYEQLNERNRIAAAFLSKISDDFKDAFHLEENLLENKKALHIALEWMLSTGISDDGLNSVFDQALDTAAALLMRNHSSANMLPRLVHLLFQRNRKGWYIHDLTWALFQSQDPDCLRLVAEYLRSTNKKDVALAQTLLRYPPSNTPDPLKLWRYPSFVSWFQENRPYLVFTGDNFNRTSAPILFRVDLDAKYLVAKQPLQQRNIPGSPVQANPTPLDAFHRATAAEQSLLARHSCRLHLTDKKQWQKWMARPIEEQIQIARGKRRERHD